MQITRTGKFDRLAVVGGCGSSGTTLLAHLISRHEDLASGPEFNCFNHPEIYDIEHLRKALPALLSGRAAPAGYIDVPVFMTFRDYYGIDDELIGTWVAESDTAEMFAGFLLDHLLSRFGCQVFVEKSPSNAYCLARASISLPGVRLVHMIRDGRDVVVSLMRRGFNLFGAGSRWLYDTRRGLAARAHPGYMELRYEDLVTRPEDTLTEFFRHLGVGGDGRSVLHEPIRKKGLYSEDWTARSEPRAWNQTPADPISTSSVGKYKSVLTPEELGMLYRIRLAGADADGSELPRSFGEMIEFLGYETKSDDWDQLPGPTRAQTIRYQGSDYVRRLRRFLDRNYFRLPRRYTRM